MDKKRHLTKGKAVNFPIAQKTKKEVPAMSLLELFCHVDDFWKAFRPTFERSLLSEGIRKRRRETTLSMSEVMTIVIWFHYSRYRDFKTYYTQYVQKHLQSEFPNLVSYPRFVVLMQRALVPLLAYFLETRGKPSGIAFIDSTPLRVCHNARIARHRVFDGLAARGKTSTGWFYGFKLHLVVNDQGEILAVHLTPGNVDDRKPVPRLTKNLVGKLFGDRGYISQALFEELYARDLQLITSLRKNMKNKLLPLWDKMMLRKRTIIETIIDQLKNISQIEHSRHRSVVNFLVNLFAGLIAYNWQDKKPSLHLSDKDLALLSA